MKLGPRKKTSIKYCAKCGKKLKSGIKCTNCNKPKQINPGRDKWIPCKAVKVTKTGVLVKR